MRSAVVPFRRVGGTVVVFCALLGAGTAFGQPLPAGPGPVPGSAPVGGEPTVGLPVTPVGAAVPAYAPVGGPVYAPVGGPVYAPAASVPVNPYLLPQQGAVAPAGYDPALPPPQDDLKGRLERLEQQNSVLQDRLQALTGAPGPDPAVGKAEEAQMRKEIDGVILGSQLGVTGKWKETGLWFETPNRDFTMHMGFWMQWDSVWFTQSAATKPPNQLGDFQDGTYFRRIRPFWEGTAYDTIEWNLILALEQIGAIGANANGLINLDEFWAGIYGIPWIGRIRFGHLKVPQGLEGNQMSSSRAMTFLENAAYTDAFYRIFGTGVQIANTAFDKRVTWQAMAYRDDFNRGNIGADFGDGQYNFTGRLTGLLLDRADDRELLHAGLSATWRKAPRSEANGLLGPNQVTLQARPEQRDAFGGFGDNVNLPGDTARMVSTGALNANSTTVLGSELAYVRGPFSAQSEWAVTYVNNVSVGNGPRTNTRSFNGGYVLVSYFLTGETRLYEKEFGVFPRSYVIPFTNFWAKDGTFGLGAWEVALRYSYINLNDGPIEGGIFSGLTAGVNWYWNPYMKVQFQYIDSLRYHKATASGGTAAGAVQGIATRVQISF
jgi:phosphate-selective porin OprO/OprP